MSELKCQQCRELAAELALNILTGRERGDALRHLDTCQGCREAVRELTSVTDRLIELIPEAQPPPGFEHRVLAALAPTRKQRTHTAVRALSVAAAAALICGELLGNYPPVATLSHPASQPGERTVSYAPLLSGNQQVGQAYFYPGHPPWIYLSLAAVSTPAAQSIVCQAIRPDGTSSPLGSFPLDHGHGTWAGPAPEPPNTLVAARLVDQGGRILATARFKAQPPPPPPQATSLTPRRPPTSTTVTSEDSASDLDGHGPHRDGAGHGPLQADHGPSQANRKPGQDEGSPSEDNGQKAEQDARHSDHDDHDHKRTATRAPTPADADLGNDHVTRQAHSPPSAAEHHRSDDASTARRRQTAGAPSRQRSPTSSTTRR